MARSINVNALDMDIARRIITFGGIAQFSGFEVLDVFEKRQNLVSLITFIGHLNYLHQSNFENSDAFDVTQMFVKTSNFKKSNRLSLTNEVDGTSKFCESDGLRAFGELSGTQNEKSISRIAGSG
jgi:hypothetical protein